MLHSQKLTIRIAALIATCFLLVTLAPSFAFASTFPHSSTVPLARGGGCGRAYVIIYLYACVSDTGSTIVPDVYVAPGRTDYSNYTYCNLNIYLYDVTTGTKTSAININCFAPLQQNYQEHIYGKGVGAAGGHTYYMQAIATYTYRGKSYTTTQKHQLQGVHEHFRFFIFSI